jgi:hypothetical protein
LFQASAGTKQIEASAKPLLDDHENGTKPNADSLRLTKGDENPWAFSEDVTMVIIRKPLIAIALLTASGLVAVAGMAQSAQRPSPAAAIEARFPGANEIMVIGNVGRAAPQPTPVVSAGKADKLVPAGCVHEHWPYVADECLLSDTSRPNRPARVIPIERRAAAAQNAAAS